jgi:hypothetical protein
MISRIVVSIGGTPLRPAIAAAIVVKPFFVFEPVLRFAQAKEHYDPSDEQHETQKHQTDDQEGVHAAGVTGPMLAAAHQRKVPLRDLAPLRRNPRRRVNAR